MNPRGREVESVNLTAPDVARARSVRSPVENSRISYKQKALRGLYLMLLVGVPLNPAIAPPAFAQEGPNQKNEQIVDPNQFTDPMVAGVVAEAEADMPAEDLPGLDNPLVDPEPILTAVNPEPIISTPDTRQGSLDAESTLIIPTPPERLYGEWPQELLQKMSKLPVPDGLRLVRYFTPEEAQKGCGANACYDAKTREARFFRGSPVGGELHALAHERSHAHQHWVVLEEGLGEPFGEEGSGQLWLKTEEGKAFANAIAQVIAASKATGKPLPSGAYANPDRMNLLEEFADISAEWYLGINRPIDGKPWLQNWSALWEFAKVWLPK